MGKGQSKENQEVIIAQNAGANEISMDQLNNHAKTTSHTLQIICVVLLIGAVIAIYRVYRSCHSKWIRREITEHQLQRSASWFRRRDPPPRAAPREDV